MLNKFKKIQEDWLTKQSNVLNIKELALPDNIKAAISQADKQDQKRECLILIAQMQGLLAKPTPKKLKPQPDAFPRLKGGRYITNQSKEMNKLKNEIICDENIEKTSPCWQFLAEKNISVIPSEFTDYLERRSVNKRNDQYLINIPFYQPWITWWKNHVQIVLTPSDLTQEKWNRKRFNREIIKSGKYNLLESLKIVLADEDENLHHQMLFAFDDYFQLDLDNDAFTILDYLYQQQATHHSERTRQYIENFLSHLNLSEKDKTSYLESAITNLMLKDNCLYKKQGKWIEPTYVFNSFKGCCIHNLWKKIAQHFNITIVQIFEHWDFNHFTSEENECFFASFSYYDEIPQELINKKYIEIINIIKNLVEDKGINRISDCNIAETLAIYASESVKNEIDYNFILNKNFNNHDVTLSTISKINNTFIKRFSLDEMLYCLNNFRINKSIDNKSRFFNSKYVYNKFNSSPDADYFFFSLSKETAKDYLNYLQKNDKFNPKSGRDRMIFNTLNLNIFTHNLYPK